MGGRCAPFRGMGATPRISFNVLSERNFGEGKKKKEKIGTAFASEDSVAGDARMTGMDLLKKLSAGQRMTKSARGLSGNLSACTGYQKNIVAAIRSAVAFAKRGQHRRLQLSFRPAGFLRLKKEERHYQRAPDRSEMFEKQKHPSHRRADPAQNQGPKCVRTTGLSTPPLVGGHGEPTMGLADEKVMTAGDSAREGYPLADLALCRA